MYEWSQILHNEFTVILQVRLNVRTEQTCFLDLECHLHPRPTRYSEYKTSLFRGTLIPCFQPLESS